MKKIISLLIILSVLISLVSCNLFGGPVPTVNGVKIKDYTIVYDKDSLDYNHRAAEYIKEQAKERFGAKLEIIDDGEAKRENEIVVGETSRDISKELNAEYDGMQFAIMAKGGSIALEADYFIIAAAAYFFVDSYMPEGGGDFLIDEEAVVRNPIVKKAKNYIMLIGDGMGFYHTKSFEYIENNVEYSDGEDFFYGYYLPTLGESRTNSLSGTTDSAAGGTALSSGHKTLNGNIGLDKNDKAIKLLTELAYEKGMSAGVMSTETDTGATPASFSAHAVDRGETASIILSQDKTKKTYGTIIDCGYDYYTPRYMTVIEKHITDTLDKLDNNENGFFLMYEEAHIDKHSHNNDTAKMFQAMVRFNQAIARFMEYAFYNPETFILITADHETGNLYPNAQGQLEYHSEDHTSKNVPVFVWGDGSQYFDGQTVENIQIAHTIASFMGEDNFGDQRNFKRLNIDK